MSQSKTRSLEETCINTFIGFILSLMLQLLVSKLYNMQVSFFDNLSITVAFTMLSLLRGYFVRRFMNKGD